MPVKQGAERGGGGGGGGDTRVGRPRSRGSSSTGGGSNSNGGGIKFAKSVSGRRVTTCAAPVFFSARSTSEARVDLRERQHHGDDGKEEEKKHPKRIRTRSDVDASLSDASASSSASSPVLLRSLSAEALFGEEAGRVQKEEGRLLHSMRNGIGGEGTCEPSGISEEDRRRRGATTTAMDGGVGVGGDTDALTSQLEKQRAALVASNVDEEEEEEEGFCNCGCGVEASPYSVVRKEKKQDEVTAAEKGKESGRQTGCESEDEGCYLLGSLSHHHRVTERLLKRKEEEVSATGKQQEGEREGVPKCVPSPSSVEHHSLRGGTCSSVYVDATHDERRSFSLSVDSGRSSDSGTLGGARRQLHHHCGESASSKLASSSSCSSSSSSSTAERSSTPSPVKIVSHSFCDFLGNVTAAVKPAIKVPGKAPAMDAEKQPPAANKVTVFVPYSALSDIKRRESSRMRMGEVDSGGSMEIDGPGENSSSCPSSAVVKSVFADNVVICDTQVILRINCHSTSADPSPSSSPNNFTTRGKGEGEEEGGEEREDCRDPSAEVHNQKDDTNEGGGRKRESRDPTTTSTKNPPPPGAKKSAGMGRHLNRRMARRMTTTVAVYEMVNSSKRTGNGCVTVEEEKDEEDKEGEEKRSTLFSGDDHMQKSKGATRGGDIKDASQTGNKNSSPRHPRSQDPSSSASKCGSAPPRRKDLCKLLGLIECDVATDATSPEDIKLAQKVALGNLIQAIQAQQQEQLRTEQQQEMEAARVASDDKISNSSFSMMGPQCPGKKKKDLAKFLGVEEVSADRNSVISHAPSSSASSQKKFSSAGPDGKPSSFLLNWGQLMKHSIRWKDSKGSADITGHVDNGDPSLRAEEDPLDLLQFHQLKSASEVVFGSGSVAASRTNRKDLNKFLGLDDSDSEEMVFIQNRKRPASSEEQQQQQQQRQHNGINGYNNSNNNDSSLNRSEQGSSSGVVSVVGIRIEPAEAEDEDDGFFFVTGGDGDSDDDNGAIVEPIVVGQCSSCSSSPDLSLRKMRPPPPRRKPPSLNNFLLHRSPPPSSSAGASSFGGPKRSHPFRSLSSATSLDRARKSRAAMMSGIFPANVDMTKKKKGCGSNPDSKSSSLGSGGQRTTTATTTTDEDEDEDTVAFDADSPVREENEDEPKVESDSDFSPPPRKSVIFKEYNNFSVEESLAQGFPVIPDRAYNGNGSGDSDYFRRQERKKKKDAARRSAEVLATGQYYHHHHRQRCQHGDHLPPPPPPSPPPLSATLDSWNNNEDGRRSRSESNSRKKGKKVQRGAMVRRHRILIPNNSDAGSCMFVDPSAAASPAAVPSPPPPPPLHQVWYHHVRPHFYAPQLLQLPPLHHHQHQPPPPQLLSYSPNGRIRQVRGRPAYDYLDMQEMKRALRHEQ